jgi:hypothetical protein
MRRAASRRAPDTGADSGDHGLMHSPWRGARSVALLVAVGLLAACTARPAPATLPAANGRTLPPAATPAAGSTPVPTLTACDPAATPGPAASAPPSPSAGVLQPMVDFPAADAFEVTAVTSTPQGFLAVGFGPRPGEEYFGLRQGIVWSSCDGATWQRSVDAALDFVTPDEVVAVGSDVFIIGTLTTCADNVEEECQDVAEAGTVVLRSSAGGPWQRLPQAPDMKLAFLEGAAAVGGRLATWGTADDEFLSSTLWLSSDGVAWTQTRDLAGMDPITALTDLDGGMLAFGNEFVEDLDDIQLMGATSPDGLRFTRVDAPPLLGGSVDAVTAGPAGYVGVGVGYPDESELALKAVALHSADGRSWVETDAADGSFAGSELESVHALPNGYVAAGLVIDDEDFTVTIGRLWLSADGRSWRSAGDFGTTSTAFITSAMGPGALVVFSTDQEETEEGDVTSSITGYMAPAGGLQP